MKQQMLEKELAAKNKLLDEIELCLANGERALTALLNLTWKLKNSDRAAKREKLNNG